MLSTLMKRGEPAELSLGLLGRGARGRNAQVTADGLGDLPDRNALVAHGVQPSSLRGLLRSQAVEEAGVQGVAGGPAVGAIAEVADRPVPATASANACTPARSAATAPA